MTHPTCPPAPAAPTAAASLDALYAAGLDPNPEPFDGLCVEDIRRLAWFKAAYQISNALDVHGCLIQAHCPVCRNPSWSDTVAQGRRFAFAVWLRATGRVTDELRPDELRP